jgi:hypothetical protein
MWNYYYSGSLLYNLSFIDERNIPKKESERYIAVTSYRVVSIRSEKEKHVYLQPRDLHSYIDLVPIRKKR